jgi:hypothetical protein
MIMLENLKNSYTAVINILVMILYLFFVIYRIIMMSLNHHVTQIFKKSKKKRLFSNIPINTEGIACAKAWQNDQLMRIKSYVFIDICFCYLVSGFNMCPKKGLFISDLNIHTFVHYISLSKDT